MNLHPINSQFNQGVFALSLLVVVFVRETNRKNILDLQLLAFWLTAYCMGHSEILAPSAFVQEVPREHKTMPRVSRFCHQKVRKEGSCTGKE